MAVGLGGEQLWLSPTVANNVNPFDDQSGQGNNGTAVGGLTTIADTSAGGAFAYDLDGVNDYIDCGQILKFTGPFSVSYWVMNDTTNKAMYYSNGHWNGQTEGYISRFDGGAGGTFWFLAHQVSTYGTGVQNPFTVSQWACVTNVYSGTHWEIYFDGVLVSQTAETRPASSNSNGLFIGATSISGWNVDGRMDDIRFFDRALTQAEITHLATSRGVLGPPGGATHYNPFKSHAFTNNFQQRLR